VFLDPKIQIIEGILEFLRDLVATKGVRRAIFLSHDKYGLIWSHKLGPKIQYPNF
jgi:hypothetical protein